MSMLYISVILCLIIGSSVSSSMNKFFFFQAEDGIRDLVRSRGLGDVYKRQDFADELCCARRVAKQSNGTGNGMQKTR